MQSISIALSALISRE